MSVSDPSASASSSAPPLGGPSQTTPSMPDLSMPMTAGLGNTAGISGSQPAGEPPAGDTSTGTAGRSSFAPRRASALSNSASASASTSTSASASKGNTLRERTQKHTTILVDEPESVEEETSSREKSTRGVDRSETEEAGMGLGGPFAGPPRRATMESGRTIRRSMTSLFHPERRLAQAPNTWQSCKNILFCSWINILLLCIPISWALHFVDNSRHSIGPVPIFVTSFLAIMPLAKLLGYGTEELALRVGQTLGGLINASLGNAVELIVAIIALFQCELTVVQTSLLGSILSNLLLVLGMCFFAGGLKYKEQEFKATAAQLNSSLLTMSVISLIIPAGFHATLGDIPDPTERPDLLSISRGVAVILLLIYFGYLGFSLFTHKEVFDDGNEDEEEPTLNMIAVIGLLVLDTVLVGVTSEWLVDSIDGVAQQGVSKVWIGLILLPIVSNAAEHVTAVTVAVKDKLDLSMGVAVGSSIQIALFVIPLLIIIAWIADKPLSLLFDPFEAIVLFLAVLVVNYSIQDGRANYMEGFILMMVYIIIALTFWFVDENSQGNQLFPDSLCKTGQP